MLACACVFGCHRHSDANDDVERQPTPTLPNDQEPSDCLCARFGASTGALMRSCVLNAWQPCCLHYVQACAVSELLLVCVCVYHWQSHTKFLGTRMCVCLCVLACRSCSRLLTFAFLCLQDSRIEAVDEMSS